METIQAIDSEILSQMDEQEAREAVDDIKKGINTVRARIYELDRRKGWKALGYRSFTACCMDQFPELQAKYVEKQLAAARVDAVLQEFPPKGGKIEELPERHARELVSLRHDPEALKSAYEKALDIADAENDGRVTTQIITQAVQESKPDYEWTEDELKRKEIVESGGTVVANMHQDTDRALLMWARKTDRFVRIDRNTEWGNPFEMGKDGDRDTVCDSYEIFFPRKFSLHNRLDELKGRVLGCWCYPARCHGAYFVDKIKEVDEFI
jgi:Glu-tRNA(Gln) amidotransferase subunit E-like FAD-binding protein